MLLGWREMMALRRESCFYLITVLLVVAPCAAHTHTVAVAVGGSYTLKPDYSGEFNAIRWLFNHDFLVELDLVPSFHLRFFRLGDRATIDNHTGVLTITHLSKSESGNYTAEVELPNLNINYTHIKLNVLDPVSKPNIQANITEEQFTVTCESATANVGYTWLDSQNKTVTTERTYSAPRSREPVHLTCIVQNQVSHDSASIIIPPLSDPSVNPVGVIVAVVVVILIIIVIEFIRWRCKNMCCVREINSCIPPFPYCKKGTAGKADDVENGAKERDNLLTNQQKGTAVTAHDAENGAKERDNLLTNQQKAQTPGTAGKVDDVENGAKERDNLLSNQQKEPFSITLLSLREGDTDGLKIKKDGDLLCEVGKIQESPLQEIALRGQKLNLCKSDKSAELTAELLLTDGRTVSHLIIDSPHSLDIELVKEVILKTNDGLLAKLFLPGSQPFAADVVLSQTSLSINSLKPGYKGKYEVCFPENHSVEFHIQVAVKKEDNKNMLKIVRIVPESQERGAQDSIGSITLQPSRIADGYIWKRGEEKLLSTSQKSEGNIFQDGKIKIDWETGVLTLQKVTPQDSDTYTLSTNDGKLNQEFTLTIEDQ